MNCPTTNGVLLMYVVFQGDRVVSRVNYPEYNQAFRILRLSVRVLIAHLVGSVGNCIGLIGKTIRYCSNDSIESATIEKERKKFYKLDF